MKRYIVAILVLWAILFFIGANVDIFSPDKDKLSWLLKLGFSMVCLGFVGIIKAIEDLNHKL